MTKISYWITVAVMEPLIVGTMQYLYWVNPWGRVYEEWYGWMVMIVSVALLLPVFQALVFIWVYFTDKERFVRVTQDEATIIFKEAPPKGSLITVKYSHEAHQAGDKFIRNIKVGVHKPPKIQMSEDR